MHCASPETRSLSAAESGAMPIHKKAKSPAVNLPPSACMRRVSDGQIAEWAGVSRMRRRIPVANARSQPTRRANPAHVARPAHRPDAHPHVLAGCRLRHRVGACLLPPLGGRHCERLSLRLGELQTAALSASGLDPGRHYFLRQASTPQISTGFMVLLQRHDVRRGRTPPGMLEVIPRGDAELGDVPRRLPVKTFGV